MKKQRELIWILFILLTAIMFLSGCNGNNGSYLAPISVLPYTSGDYGSLKGVIRTNFKPYRYFNLIKLGEPGEDDPVLFLSSGGEMYDDSTFVVVDGDTFEVMQKNNTDILDFNLDDEINTRIKANIRIGGKTYSYNPEFEEEYTVDDIPVGFHSLSIEVNGFEVYKENIMVEDGEKIKNFNIEPVEYKAPNYFRKISRVYCTITDFEEKEKSDEDEEEFTNTETKKKEEREKFLKILWNKVTRFSKKDISVYIDDSNLVSNGLNEYKYDLIDMLALWENTDAGIVFNFITDREKADITVLWEDISSSYNWSMTDSENPYRVFKPVITLALFNSSGNKINTTFRRAVMAREIGRSLGLIGNSGNNNDIMYYGSDLNIEGDITLSASDKNTLIMLYNTVPAISEKTYNLN
ncbi:MAG: hypothetical protein M0R46_08090 [Candidatus Muirbacterium halophilum]|nr:hypothetical protein [Candidatus Muirbacterium halophilum]